MGAAKLIAAPSPGRAASRGRCASTTCSAPARRSCSRTPSRRSASAVAKAARRRGRVACPRSPRAPVSGSTRTRWPASGSAPSRGSPTSTATTVWRAPRRAQRARPAGVAEVRDDDDHAARPRQALHARQRVRDPGAGGRRRRATTPDCTSRAHRRQRAAAAARRQQPDPLGAGDDDADAPAAADREPRDDLGDALGHVALEPVGGAERHRGGDVEHEPGRDRALGDLEADVRRAGARAGRRVEPADVVARLVGPQLRDLGAGAEAGGRGGRRAGPRTRAGAARGRAARPRRRAGAPGPGGPGGTMSWAALTRPRRAAPCRAGPRRRARGRAGRRARTPSASAS